MWCLPAVRAVRARSRPWPSCSPRTTRSWSARTCREPLVSTESVERIAAGARARGVGVVDREALLLDRVDEVDRRALDIGRAHPVHRQRDATELSDEVAVKGPIVEEQVVAQPGASARLDGDAQSQVVTALLVQQRLRLRGRGVREDCAVGGGAGRRLVLNSHCVSLSASSCGANCLNGTLFRRYSRVCPQAAAVRSDSPASWFAASSMASCTDPAW